MNDFRPIQTCKKDNVTINYENIEKQRDNIDIYEKKNNKINNKTDLKKYNKEDFINEFNKLHNNIYFNPYEILNIDKDYTLDVLKKKYKEYALIYHPDKETGDIDIFKNITKSYLYLLKKYKENIPDKQIYELKNEYDDYLKNEGGNKNILLDNKKFNLDKFNKVFDDFNKKDTDGYGDFMKTGEQNIEEENNYIFSDDFNINIFNKIFNEKIKKKESNVLNIYKEPETLVQTNCDYNELGQDKTLDYSSMPGFNKKIQYTDCKIAYSEPEKVEEKLDNTFNSLEDLKNYRKNINYSMNNEEKDSYNNYIKSLEVNEINRINRLKMNDTKVYNTYKTINKVLLNN